MGGIGTSPVEGTRLGRDAIGVELEASKLAGSTSPSAKSTWHAPKGPPGGTVIRGDATARPDLVPSGLRVGWG